MHHKGPFILEYLNITHDTIIAALNQHPRLSAFRFDLRFPYNSPPNNNLTYGIIQRFVDSLKAKINHNRTKSAQRSKRVHNTKVKYVWTKEHSKDGRPHFHFLLLLNHDAYRSLGWFHSESGNTSTRISEAWASALGLSLHEAQGLVYFPDNSTYRLNQKNGNADIAPLFERASYMCKADTKKYGDRSHAFGCSRTSLR